MSTEQEYSEVAHLAILKAFKTMESATLYKLAKRVRRIAYGCRNEFNIPNQFITMTCDTYNYITIKYFTKTTYCSPM